MPKSVIQYSLLISCPGDIKEEINCVEECVTQFNTLFRAVFLPVATGCKGLSTPFAGPCTLPVNIGAECLVGGQNRPPEVLAQQRIRNHLHAHAALAVIQRHAIAAIIVGAQPPD